GRLRLEKPWSALLQVAKARFFLPEDVLNSVQTSSDFAGPEFKNIMRKVLEVA
ncbi:unnamed protein product, partial [Amoebophrya sp. A120]